MKFLLASAPHRDTFGYSMPPPGLLRLGAALKSPGSPPDLDVELDDLAFRLASGDLPAGDGLARASAAWLLRREPDVLGLSTMGATVPVALAIAREVRAERPGVQVILGGPGVTGLDQALIQRFEFIDVVVRGEGELILPELLDRIRAGESLAGLDGITHRNGSGDVIREADRAPIADLGSLGETAWDLLPSLAEYKAVTGEEEGLAPIDSGRGCVFDCSFCTIGRFWNRRSRTLPVNTLVHEIERLTHIPGARRAYLCHDIFGADRRHALAFCEAMLEADCEVPWEVRARVDHLDAELVERMGRAGCYRVLLGVESADEQVLDQCNKSLSATADVLAVVAHCAAAGIVPILSLVLGLPGEDDDALAHSLDLCARASLIAGVQISLHLVNPQPGCGLGEEFGADARPVAGIPPDMALGAGETGPERELIAEHADLFTTWALLPQGEPRLRELHAIASTCPELLMRYPTTIGIVRRAFPQYRSMLALIRHLQSSSCSFEGFVSKLAGPSAELARESLALEQARVRCAARGTPDIPPSAPKLHGELVRTAFDLPAAQESLTRDEPLSAAPHSTSLFVHARDGRVTTSRISDGLASLIERIDGRRTLAELGSGKTSIKRALTELTERGWIVTPKEPIMALRHPPEVRPS